MVSAVRAVQQSQPELKAGGSRAVNATRRQLPPPLAQLPTPDLRDFSQVFGKQTPTDPIYTGEEDTQRDASVQAYRASDNMEALEDSFSLRESRQVMALTDAYPEPDFQTIVQAVRQTRTADPDLEAGSTSAVRAIRRQLPQRLRQMPTTDLAVFSSLFGGSADTPNVTPLRSGDQATTRPIRFTPPPPNVTEQDALARVPGIGLAMQSQLHEAGIGTVQALATADPAELAQLRRVSLARATRWVASAQQVANTPLDPSVPITTSFIGRVTPPPPASKSDTSIIEASPSATVIPPNTPTASRPSGEPLAPQVRTTPPNPPATVIPPNTPIASRPAGEPLARQVRTTPPNPPANPARPSQQESSSTPAPTPSTIEGSESPPPSVVTRNNLPPTAVDGDRS